MENKGEKIYICNREVFITWLLLMAMLFTVMASVLCGYSKEIVDLKAKNTQLEQELCTKSSKSNTLEVKSNKLEQILYKKDKEIEKLKGTEFKITQYTLRAEECSKGPEHKWFGYGASGRKVKVNHSIAVDPKVIPLGSKVKIEGFDEIFTADDTGNAIKGNTIDIFVGNPYTDDGKCVTEALRFGVQNRKVWVLDNGENSRSREHI